MTACCCPWPVAAGVFDQTIRYAFRLWEQPRVAVDIRNLKALGLTISLRVGYQLSAGGQAYLATRNG